MNHTENCTICIIRFGGNLQEVEVVDPSKIKNTAVVSELEIVDICTKLIFGIDEKLSLHEQLIITALRLSDENFAGDDAVEMGKYLRALGVKEMIKLVAAAKQHIDAGHLLSCELVPAKNQYIH